ncbi:MAG: 30S ribosomal protein S16 [Patescibacteria group bacterium]|nr:30S ribosomal protein S16 [Patescibacteria group bacterium]
MLRIRLSRVGKKNKAQFRVTVADARRSPTGKFIEILGYYNPHTKEKVFKQERIEYWISKGAKPSATVHNFLVDAGVIKGDKIVAWRPKKKKRDEKEAEQKTEKKAEEPISPKEEIKKEEVKDKTEKKTEEK